jgi:N-acyl-D-aspartate/D-glutamate deacylase
VAVYDVHIKGGLVVDGTRLPRFRADVWIKDGHIAQIGGRSEGDAEQVIDADGLIVAPGFVDTHTHYDAQIRWDPWCTISGWHGVTTVVLGNCGFGFAPCKPEFRERSMLTMTRNEAIPLESMKAGLLPVWDWESIPEYLDNLDRTPKGVNAVHYMPTASLMTYVMGLEAAKSRPATPGERDEMKRLLHEGMDAGLCGFSIQRLGPNSLQTDFDGSPMVTDTMTDDDVLALAEVLRDRREGSIQISQSTEDPKADVAFEQRLAEVAQRPIIHNVVVAGRSKPLYKPAVRWLEKCWQKGLQMYGQGSTHRTGFAFTLEHWNLYDASPAWRAVTTGTKAEKLTKMSSPDMRDALVRETEEADKRLQAIQAGVGGDISKLVIQGVNRQANLQQYVGKSVGQIAEGEHKHPVEVMLDLSVAGDLNVEFLAPDRGASAEYTTALLTESPYTWPGSSDGGAHMKFLTGGSFTTDFLRWLVRDEKTITLEEAHYRLSTLPARASGIRDRGLLVEGAPADVVVYELESLDIEPPWIGEVAHDLPAGEWRRIQRAKGYRSIIVNGVETFADGKGTGETPGQLLRHGRAQPAL